MYSTKTIPIPSIPPLPSSMPVTTINYQIPQTGFVSLKVYDILEREVAILVNEEKAVGNYEAEFNGSELASGIYFYKLRADNYTSVKKMILLK